MVRRFLATGDSSTPGLQYTLRPISSSKGSEEAFFMCLPLCCAAALRNPVRGCANVMGYARARRPENVVAADAFAGYLEIRVTQRRGSFERTGNMGEANVESSSYLQVMVHSQLLAGFSVVTARARDVLIIGTE